MNIVVKPCWSATMPQKSPTRDLRQSKAFTELEHAAALERMGKLDEADSAYANVVRKYRDYFDALHIYGLFKLKTGKLHDAEKLIQRAIKINPRSLNALNSLGVVFGGLDRHKDAISVFHKILDLDKDNVLALSNRANSLNHVGRYSEAIDSCDQALRHNPLVVDAYVSRGAALLKLNHLDAALQNYQKAIDIRPSQDAAWLGFGNALYSLQRYEEASAAYGRACSLNPTLANAWLGRGNTFYELKRYDDALAAYERALFIKPTLESAWTGRGKSFTDLKRYEEALAAYHQALSIMPNLEDAWIGRGYVLSQMARYDDALAAYDKALSIKPDLENAWLDRGYVLFCMNRDLEALRCFDQALSLKPGYAEANLNKAILKLSLGDYDDGWRLYEWRWKAKFHTSPVRDFAQPLWLNDADISNKTILIHAEQGLGDTIQFSRYLDLLRDQKCQVIFEVQKPLAALYQSDSSDYTIIVQGEPIPPFDVHCPLMSLPFAFNTRPETIPEHIPYLATSNEKRAGWAGRIGQRRAPRIGLAWSGNPFFARGNDIARPIPLSVLCSILRDDMEWYRLQKDIRDGDQQVLHTLATIRDFSSMFDDLSDTAALIEELDLVISIDTSIAHLAGALGKPVWILLSFHPDFRWLRDRTDSPWYPTARLFRQTNDGDWSNVIGDVSRELTKLGSEHSRT